MSYSKQFKLLTLLCLLVLTLTGCGGGNSGTDNSEETEYDYWTSTNYFLNKALKVRFKDGFYTYNFKRDQTYRVRLVRGGQP